MFGLKYLVLLLEMSWRLIRMMQFWTWQEKSRTLVNNIWVLLPQTWLETTWWSCCHTQHNDCLSSLWVLTSTCGWRSGLTALSWPHISKCLTHTQVNVSLLSSCSSSLHTHSVLSVCLSVCVSGSEAVSLFNITSETCLFRRPHLHLPPPSAAADWCRLRLASTAQDAHTLMWEHTHTHTHTHSQCVCVCVSGLT